MANAPLKVDLEACIKGAKWAWDDFVCACSPLIYAAVKRTYRARRCSQQELEDRVQDVFVHLVQKDFHLLRAFDAKRASLSTYLTLVARSVTHQHAQKKRVATVPLDAMQFPAPAAIDAADQSLPALNGLTERQLVVLQMLFEQGLSVEEAAQNLDVDPQTIRSTKHKAMIRLRQQMQEKSGDGG